MRKRTSIVSLLCLAVSACGGSSTANGGNAAASKQFTYGSPTAADASQAGALQSSLTTMTSVQSSPGASNAESVAQFSSVTQAMLGGYSVASAGPGALVQETALAKARAAALYSPSDYGSSFDNPACVTVTSTSVTLKGCKLTVTESSSGGSSTATVSADGSVTLSNSNQTLAWDLTFAVTVTVSSSSGSASGGGHFHGAGEVTVQAPTAGADGTIKGSMTSESSFNASGNGQSISMAVDESLDIDVTYETSPSNCVTGGTIEAKRVFPDWSVPNVTRPSDKGAKITFTSGACNTGTIQFSN